MMNGVKREVWEKGDLRIYASVNIDVEWYAFLYAWNRVRGMVVDRVVLGVFNYIRRSVRYEPYSR